MELLATILLPLPLGLLLNSRMAAFITYIAIHGFLFTFQSTSLLIEWAGGSTKAFGPYPDADSAAVWAYGAVNLVIFLVGLGLVWLGSTLRARRRSDRPLSLDPTPVR
jgi:hypothetical protein